MPLFRWYYIFPFIPLYLFSWLPGFLLYGLSDILRILTFYVFGYRKEIVLQNLRNSFPEKDEAWIQQMAWKFYRNLFDVMLETLQMPSRSKRFFKKSCPYTGLENITQFTSKGQPVVLVCGHVANWEWGGQSLQQHGVQVDVLYHPLSSRFFDWYMYWIRSRYEIQPVAMQQTLRVMLSRKHIPSAVSFIADQTPSAEGCHWMTFMHQDTPVFGGVEKLAKRFSYPVVYVDVDRVGRGKYKADIKLICQNPNDLPDNMLTETHMKMLEETILRAPENWLWSHRRWKHKRK